MINMNGLRALGVTYKTLAHPKAKEAARHAFQKKIAEYQKGGKPIVYLETRVRLRICLAQMDSLCRPERCPGKHGCLRGATRCAGRASGGRGVHRLFHHVQRRRGHFQPVVPARVAAETCRLVR